MVGQKLGVMGNIKDHNKQVFSSGCPCHLIHIAAEKASQELPFSLDNVLIDIYYYLDKSSKRLASLEESHELYGVQHHKILKYVCTRWLSISKCLDRLLENWDALKAFYKSELKSFEASTKSASKSTA